MSHKSNAMHLLKAFIVFVENQFHKKVKLTRSDNDLEFDDKPFYSEKGIMHHASIIDTPQQNGRVERKHRHLIKIARALFFQTN